MDRFLDAIARRRADHVASFMNVPDGDALKQAAVRNKIIGLDEAADLYKKLQRIDSEEE